MSLLDYKSSFTRCVRCSLCKWVPSPQVRSQRFSIGCPSILYGNFHAYSGGGKAITALGLMQGVVDYSDDMLKTVHACSMCGACDISCKLNYQDKVNLLEGLRELRLKCVEDGQMDPTHMIIMDGLKKEDNVFGEPKADRSKWAEGLGVKDVFSDKVDVYLHVGCHFAYDEGLWPVIRGVVRILQAADISFGIAMADEGCCGGRAFDMGFKGVAANFAEATAGRVKESGAKTLLTCCADGFGTFKQLYPMVGFGFKDVEVLHIAEYMARLMKEGKLTLNREVPMRVTYHDPCHLGRLGEAWTPWSGTYKKVLNTMTITDPPREVLFGNNGVYNAAREVLNGIPGLEFVEMERIREYSFCCGAGGGAKEAYPDFALMAGNERIQEAKSTGAEALVTACPWCERNFKDAVQENNEKMAVFDVVELVLKAMGINE